MKTLTVTTLRSINYGGVIQAFALHHFLKNHKIDNQLLDYCALKNMYVRIMPKFSRSTMIAIAEDFFYFVNHKKSSALLERFNKFIDENLKKTRPYSNYNDIINDIPDADVYISGSDQVFGVRGKFDDIRMLQFVPEDKICISYAASLGEYDWNIDEENEFKRRLKRFKYISVREKYASDYIQKNSGVYPVVNIDPVFLLDKKDYLKVSSNKINFKRPYILCYSLISNVDFQKVIDEVKEITGYETVSVHTLPMKRIKTDHYVFDAGPAEFLALLNNAKFVITSSFHGTALSIIFEKPFYTLIKNYKSQRIVELLDKFGMSDRIYCGKDINLNIDFCQCKYIIDKEKSKTDAYFNKIIIKE